MLDIKNINFETIKFRQLNKLQTQIEELIGLKFGFPLRKRQLQAIYFFLGGNDILCVLPTTYGKTLIACVCAVIVYLQTGLKTLYIGMLKSLTAEMQETLADFFADIPIQDFERDAIEDLMEESGLPEEDCLFEIRKAIISDGDHRNITIEDFASDDWCIGCFTPEKFDSICNNAKKRAILLQKVGCIIHDEIHTLGSEGRGHRMEHYLITLWVAKPELRHIYLSATVGNPDVLAEWLNAVLIYADPSERPVQMDLTIKTYIKEWWNRDANKPNYHENEKKKRRALRSILRKNEECNTIGFTSSRRKTEELARMVADDEYSNMKGLVVNHQIGYHHAGLEETTRTFVQDSFKDGSCTKIFATPTLAVGVNLPCDLAVLVDSTKWDACNGERLLGANRVQQTLGRCGRATHTCRYCEGEMIDNICNKCGWENRGRAFIICAEEDKEEMYKRATEPLDVESKLKCRLPEKILQWMKSGLANNMEEVYELCTMSFDKTISKKECDRAMRWLRAFEFVMENDVGDFTITLLGSKTIDMYIMPETTLDWELQKANVIDPTDLDEVFIRFANTPEYMNIVTVRQEDGYIQYAEEELGYRYPRIEQVTNKPCLNCLKLYDCEENVNINGQTDCCGQHEQRNDHYIPEKILKIYFLTFYGDLAEKYLPKKRAWRWVVVNGKKVKEWYDTDEIKHVAISHGDKKLLQSTGSRLFSACAYIFNDDEVLGKSLKLLSQLVEAGTMNKELVSLIKIPKIGIARATKLYNGGIKNVQDFIDADQRKLTKLLGLSRRVILDIKSKI